MNPPKTRKLLSLLLLVVAIFTLSSCGVSSTKEKLENQTTYEKIQIILTELKTYKSIADVEYKSNRGSNTYETLQHCKITGEYRIEVLNPPNVAGNVTLSDGKTIYQYNPKIAGKLAMSKKENQERSELFITSFIKNYTGSQEVTINVANLGDGKCTVLEATIPGQHPYLSTEKLWVDNTTLKPVKLVVYDPDGAERIVVTYKSFEYNVEMDDKLFVIDIES